MSAPTPGPWEFVVEDHDFYIRTAEGKSLQSNYEYYPWTSDNEADWHLIAAAPELLETLIELADCGAEAWGSDRPCVVAARAAIAKATGETK